jgi:hypothetical protein
LASRDSVGGPQGRSFSIDGNADSSASMTLCSGQHAHDLAASRPGESGDTDDFSGSHVEIEFANATAGQLANFQRYRSRCSRPRGKDRVAQPWR